MTRVLLTRTFLVAIGLLLGALAAEMWIRLFPERPGLDDDRPAYLAGPPRISPFRERPEIPTKRPGVFRIVVLGDSFTWGANVQMNYTYPKLLESLLKRAGGEYEVYNFGVNGANTADEVDLLDKLASHEPDLFLLGYFLNDAAADPELGEPVPESSWLGTHSRLMDFLERRLWARQLAASQLSYFQSLYQWGGPSWQAHRRTVGRLARSAARLGVPLQVVIWPHLAFSLDEKYPFRDIHSRLRALFAEQHLPALDLLEVFAGRDHDRLQAVPRYDPHPSEIAHRLAAEAVFDWLKKTQPVVAPAVQAKTETTAGLRLVFLGDLVDGEGAVLRAQSYPRHVEWLIRTACREAAQVDVVRTRDPVGELRRKLLNRPEVIVVEKGAPDFQELATIQRESGVRLLVLRWPNLDSPMDLTSQKLPDVATLDLAGIFRGKDLRRLQADPGRDPRPNEIAHRMAGEAVFDWLRANEPRVAESLVEPRLHPNPPHWRRWQDRVSSPSWAFSSLWARRCAPGSTGSSVTTFSGALR